MADAIKLFALFVVALLVGFGVLMWVLFHKKITGPRFLIFIVAFFGVVIAVNVGMAYQATETFPASKRKPATAMMKARPSTRS